MKSECIFCGYLKLDPEDLVADNQLFYSRWDKNPVSNGHLLVIPKRHIESFFELNNQDLLAMYSLVKEGKAEIEKQYRPDGYNIGVNDGIAAGRTVHHFHLHIIPRYEGDVEDARGGVRHILPGKGFYNL